MSKFECEVCNASFGSKQGLNVHRVRKHTEKGKTWGKSTAKANAARANRKPPKKKAKAQERTLMFCPCCGLNIGLAERAIQVAQEIG